MNRGYHRLAIDILFRRLKLSPASSNPANSTSENSVQPLSLSHINIKMSVVMPPLFFDSSTLLKNFQAQKRESKDSELLEEEEDRVSIIDIINDYSEKQVLTPVWA